MPSPKQIPMTKYQSPNSSIYLKQIEICIFGDYLKFGILNSIFSVVLLQGYLISVILACPESFLKFLTMQERFPTSGNDKRKQIFNFQIPCNLAVGLYIYVFPL
jgi:hypothetical protein